MEPPHNQNPEAAIVPPIFSFPKGSIVRIKLQNFLNLEPFEFHPGPGVNMIYGRNCTGKSSIIYAICLGLCGKERAINKNSGIRRYIRSGCESAVIEIELSNFPQNSIVRRTIRRDTKFSLWELNGQKVKEGQIRSLMTELNIHFQRNNTLHLFSQENCVQNFYLEHPRDLLNMTLMYLDNSGGLVETTKKIRRLEKELRALAGADDLVGEEIRLKTMELNTAEESFLMEVGPHIAQVSSKFRELMGIIEESGEIWIEKGTDKDGFSKYTIEIKVSCRYNGRDSGKVGLIGGFENSAIGIFFLLAVHSCGVAPPPFRLLDEFVHLWGAHKQAEHFEAKILDILNSLESPQYFMTRDKRMPGPLVPDYGDVYDNIKFHVLPDRMIYDIK